MTPEETYDLIEQYLQGDLSDADRRSFENRLTEDAELSEELEIHRAAFELVVDSGVLQAKEKLNRIHRMETGKGKVRKWKIYLSGIILTALVGAGGYYYWSTMHHKDSAQNSSVSPSSITNTNSTGTLTQEKNEDNNKVVTTSPHIVPKENKISVTENTVSNSSLVDTTAAVLKKDTDPIIKNIIHKDSSVIKSSTAGTDCSVVKITGNVDTKASCASEATGVIMIDLGSIRGGVKPYRYSISGEEEFGVSAHYSHLTPGQYMVKVKDRNGCTGILETVTIESSNCSKEFAFAPSRGEEWEIPVSRAVSGEIKIIDRKGTTVYVSSFYNGETILWKGLDQNGQELPAGVYLFFISYTNGDSQQGYVTLLK